MSKILETKVIHFHDCPVLGKQTRVIEATLVSKDGKVVLGWQNKCPFCSSTASEFRPAPGVTVTGPGRYSVDMSKAILTEEAA